MLELNNRPSVTLLGESEDPDASSKTPALSYHHLSPSPPKDGKVGIKTLRVLGYSSKKRSLFNPSRSTLDDREGERYPHSTDEEVEAQES